MNHDPAQRGTCGLCGATYNLSNFHEDYLEKVGGDPRLCIPCHQWKNRGMEPVKATCPGCREEYIPEETETFQVTHIHHWNKGKERLTVCSLKCKQQFERTGF